MLKNPLFAAAASAALFTLSACGSNEPEVVNSYDPQAEALSKAAPVQLPPAVTESRTYRCSDNSLAYVDFYNNHTAVYRRTQNGATTALTQANGAGPYAGEGVTVSGTGTHVSINGKSCHT